jgi:hypothetical protein
MEQGKLGQESAFPIEYEEFNSVGLLCKRGELGITKRFYAACAAMQGMLAAPHTTKEKSIQLSTFTLEKWRSEIDKKFGRLMKYEPSFNLLVRLNIIPSKGKKWLFYFEKIQNGI